MIHTFELYTILSGSEARQVLCHLGVPRNKDFFEGEGQITGISAMKLWRRKNTADWFLKVAVNPARLIYGFGAFETIPIVDAILEQVEIAFSPAIFEATGNSELPKMSSWQVARVDYAVDIRTPYVKEYVKLAEKGDMGAWLKNGNDEDGSCYWQSVSVTANIYDKQDELFNRKTSTFEMVQRAQDILRIEIQCNSSKVSYIRRKEELHSRSLRDYFKRELAKEILIKYSRSCFKAGTYYSMEELNRQEHFRNSKSRQKRAFEQMIRAIAQARSIQNAREKLDGCGVMLKNVLPKIPVKLSKEQFCRNCSLLAMLNINPVLIPRDWKISQLPSIATLVEQIFQD